MDHTESCRVSGPMARVLRISSLLGIVPLQLTPLRNQTQRISPNGAQKVYSGHPNYIASISRKRQIFGYVVIFIILTLQAITLYHQLIFEAGSSHRIRTGLSKVFLIVIAILSLISILVTGFDGVNKMKRYMSYVNKLEEINLELESSHLDLKIKNSGIIIWGFLSTFLLHFVFEVFSIAGIGLTDDEHGYQMWQLRIYLIPIIVLVLSFAIAFGFCCKHIFNVLLYMQFVFIVCSVKVTLRTQNERLRSLIFKLKLYGDAMKTKNITNAHITIRRLYRAYVSICEVLRNISDGEGALVAIILLCKIMECTDSFNHVISITYASLDDWSYRKFLNLGLPPAWAFFKVAMIVLMVEQCHETQEEFQTTQIHVSHLMCASADRKFKDELSRFYNHVANEIPSFSPLGICVLTRQFLVGIIGGIATFLAIVLQFRLIDGVKLQNLS